MQAGKPVLVLSETSRARPLATLVVNRSAHVPQRRGEGSGLRRPSQGHAAGHRDPHGRHGDLRGRSASRARERHVDLLGHRPQGRRHHKDETTIVEGGGRTRTSRAAFEPDQGRDREDGLRLRPREAPGAARKLSGGVAVIKVGAATAGRAQGEEAPHRGRGAVHQAAVEEGIVPGGGVALLNAQVALDKVGPRGRRAHRRRDRAQGARGAAQADRAQRRPRGRRDRREGPRARPPASASTPPPGEYVDMIKAVWSTPPRSPAPPCRTRPASRPCS